MPGISRYWAYGSNPTKVSVLLDISFCRWRKNINSELMYTLSSSDKCYEEKLSGVWGQ